MAVRVCSGMSGQIIAPGIICTSAIHGGRMSQRAMDGDVTMYRMYGQIIAPGIICTSTIHGGRIAQGAKDGSAGMYRM